MSNIVKEAYEAGVQQALADLGVIKNAEPSWNVRPADYSPGSSWLPWVGGTSKGHPANKPAEKPTFTEESVSAVNNVPKNKALNALANVGRTTERGKR